MTLKRFYRSHQMADNALARPVPCLRTRTVHPGCLDRRSRLSETSLSPHVGLFLLPTTIGSERRRNRRRLGPWLLHLRQPQLPTMWCILYVGSMYLAGLRCLQKSQKYWVTTNDCQCYRLPFNVLKTPWKTTCGTKLKDSTISGWILGMQTGTIATIRTLNVRLHG